LHGRPQTFFRGGAKTYYLPKKCPKTYYFLSKKVEKTYYFGRPREGKRVISKLEFYI